MWTSLALAAALSLSPGQGAGLTLSNARATFGELGNPRPDTKMLPGDIFFVAFDIEGIKVDEEGKVLYSMAMEVTDKNGKSIFKQQPVDRNDFLPLGGNKLPARAFVSVGLDQEPGTYTCKVTVTDRAAKTSKTLEQNFEVLPKAFGLVQVYTSADAKGEVPAPTLGVAGQSVWVHFAVVGFERDTKSAKATKQPNVAVEMAVLNKDGTKTLPKPTATTIDGMVDEKDNGIPLRFLLPMNRAGDFIIELKATDALSKKTSRVTLPIKVLPPPG
jgi:hypothetical protein